MARTVVGTRESRTARASLRAATLILLSGATAGLARGDAPRSYEVQPAESLVRIHVGTAGLFGFLGHEHVIDAGELRGRVTWNPDVPERSSVRLEIPTASLRVVDPDVDADTRAKIQAEMETEVLGIDEHPSITFESTGFRPDETESTPGAPFHATLLGTLTLHGVGQTLTFPVRVDVDPRELRASGEVTFKGSRFGIRPVRAGAGTVKTKDALRITFELVARPSAE